MSTAGESRPDTLDPTVFSYAMRDAVERVEVALSHLRGVATRADLAPSAPTCARPTEIIQAAVAMERQATYAQIHARQLMHLVDGKP